MYFRPGDVCARTTHQRHSATESCQRSCPACFLTEPGDQRIMIKTAGGPTHTRGAYSPDPHRLPASKKENRDVHNSRRAVISKRPAEFGAVHTRSPHVFRGRLRKVNWRIDQREWGALPSDSHVPGRPKHTAGVWDTRG
jgi:hypothetical protein